MQINEIVEGYKNLTDVHAVAAPFSLRPEASTLADEYIQGVAGGMVFHNTLKSACGKRQVIPGMVIPIILPYETVTGLRVVLFYYDDLQTPMPLDGLVGAILQSAKRLEFPETGMSMKPTHIRSLAIPLLRATSQGRKVFPDVESTVKTIIDKIHATDYSVPLTLVAENDESYSIALNLLKVK